MRQSGMGFDPASRYTMSSSRDPMVGPWGPATRVDMERNSDRFKEVGFGSWERPAAQGALQGALYDAAMEGLARSATEPAPSTIAMTSARPLFSASPPERH